MWLTLLTWLAALGPAYVATWCGCWGLTDLYLLPDQRLASGVVSVCVGLVVGYPLVYLRREVAAETAGRRPLAALHAAVALPAAVLLWRGYWRLLDAALGRRPAALALSALAGAAPLAALGCLPTAAVMPPLPQRRCGAASATLLEVDPVDRPLLAIGDALLSLVAVEACCLLVWRGCWGLLDLLLGPAAPPPLAVAALAAGAFGLAVCSLGPRRLGWASAAESEPPSRLRRLREDAVAMVTVVCLISFWKGLWNLLDLMSIPEYPWPAYVLLYVLGFFILGVTGFAQVFRAGGVVVNDGTMRWLEPLSEDLDAAESPSEEFRLLAESMSDR